MTQVTTQPNRIRIALVVIGGLLWVAVFGVLYAVWQDRRQSIVDGANDDNRSQAYVLPVKFLTYDLPDFELTECRGATVSKNDLKGKPWVAAFLFTRCNTECPRVESQLRQLDERLGKTDVRIVVFSVDPQHDTPRVLRNRYGDLLRTSPDRWLFLTGKQSEIYDLIQQGGFKLSVAQNTGKARTKGNEVTHSQSVLLVDGNGTVVGKYSGTGEEEMARLEAAIRRLVSVQNQPQPNSRKPSN